MWWAGRGNVWTSNAGYDFTLSKSWKKIRIPKIVAKWFVLSKSDARTPGLLKPEFSTKNGEMICLAPKSYMKVRMTRISIEKSGLTDQF